MRRKECERDAAFAWEVLKNSIYSTVSMVCPDGTPYATPVNIIGDEVYNALYFHCAGAGERWELLKNGAPVCVTAVSTATLLPNQFTTAYRPKGMGRFDQAMAHCPAQVIKIVPEVITGKEHEMHQEPPKAHTCHS